MSKKLNTKEFKEFIKKMMLQELKINALKEFSEDEEDDDLGIYSGNFDQNEFEGDAMKAAMQDIGDEFVPLGKSKFEKKLDPEEFKADLNRQNLNLPNDKGALDKIKKVLKVKDKHEKLFGKGSLNEKSSSTNIGGIDRLKKIFTNPEVERMFLGFGNNERQILDITDVGFILDKDIFGVTIKKLMPYNFLMDEWGPIWYITVNIQNRNEPIMIDFDFSEEEKQKFPDMETPMELARQDFADVASDDELNSLDEKKLNETGEWSDDKEYEKLLSEKMFRDLSTEAYFPEKNPNSMSNTIIKRMMADGILDYDTEGEHDEDTGRVIKGSIQDFYWLNEKGIAEIKSPQDIIDNYFYSSGPDAAERAEKKYFSGSEGGGGMDENLEPQINRPTDADGKPITLKARVQDLDTQSIGHVLRFGVDNNGKQTVHVEWIQKFGAQVPKTITYPGRVVVKTSTKLPKEIEEGSIRSHANSKGQNKKPGNFPQALKRVGLKENLEQAISQPNTKVFLVINNDFNRAHYSDLIGKTFTTAPSYAKTKLINPEDVENEKAIKYDEEENQAPVQENEFNRSEIEYDGRQELESLAADSTKYVPENLQQFLVPNSFAINKANEDGKFSYSYTLKIKKQPDETLKDIEKFIREEEPNSNNGPGQSYQKVSMYTELEKGSDKWIIQIEVIRGYDV